MRAHIHRITLAAAFVAAGGAAAPGYAQTVGQDVATATVAANVVEFSLPTLPPRRVAVDDRVQFGGQVRTGALSANVNRFDDGTMINIGANAAVGIDRFVYAPASGTGEMTVNLARGAMRFVTGKMQAKSYGVRTPFAIIGVRGTVFVLGHDAAGGSTVVVETGSVTFANTAGAAVVVPAGFASTISGPNDPPSPPAPASPAQQAVVAALNVALATVAPPALTMPTTAQAIAGNAAAAAAASAAAPAMSTTADFGGDGDY